MPRTCIVAFLVQKLEDELERQRGCDHKEVKDVERVAEEEATDRCRTGEQLDLEQREDRHGDVEKHCVYGVRTVMLVIVAIRCGHMFVWAAQLVRGQRPPVLWREDHPPQRRVPERLGLGEGVEVLSTKGVEVLATSFVLLGPAKPARDGIARAARHRIPLNVATRRPLRVDEELREDDHNVDDLRGHSRLGWSSRKLCVAATLVLRGRGDGASGRRFAAWLDCDASRI